MEITKKQRIGIVLSVVWLLIALIPSNNITRNSMDFFITYFVFGILPTVICWGIWWIRQANRLETMEITKKQRIGIVLSVVWLLIALIPSNNITRNSTDFFITYSIFGILPTVICWGIWWIRQANRLETKSDKNCSTTPLRFRLSNNTQYKIIIVLFGVSLLGLFLNSLSNYGGNDDFFVVGFPIGIFISLGLRFIIFKPRNSEPKIESHWFLLSLALIPLFMVSALIFVNRNCDYSEPVYHKLNVLDKYEYDRTTKSGETKKTYAIVVNSWKSNSEKEKISIRQDQYNKVNIGTQVAIKTKRGLLRREFLFGPPDQIIEIQ